MCAPLFGCPLRFALLLSLAVGSMSAVGGFLPRTDSGVRVCCRNRCGCCPSLGAITGASTLARSTRQHQPAFDRSQYLQRSNLTLLVQHAQHRQNLAIEIGLADETPKGIVAAAAALKRRYSALA